VIESSFVTQLVQERQARLEAQREDEYQRLKMARMRARVLALGLAPDEMLLRQNN